MNFLNLVDLQREYGHQYKVVTEDGSKSPDPWLQIVLCRYGHVYLHGHNLLGVSTDKRGSIATKLAALSFTTLVANGDDGCNFTFPADSAEQVFAIMHPRKRRHLSPEEKARLQAVSARYRFKAAPGELSSDRTSDAEDQSDNQAA